MTKRELKRMRAASEELHRDDKAYKRAENADFLTFIVGVVLIALCIRTFVFEPIRVIGPSMHPTLVDGEGMFVEKITYTFTAPERGDIIICRYPGYVVECVKRVIGEPGDRVEVYDGSIYLNGELLDESAYWDDYIFGDMSELTVPEDSLFVVGDNRNWSGDSRDPSVGCIPYSQVKGKVRGVIFPTSNARIV